MIEDFRRHAARCAQIIIFCNPFIAVAIVIGLASSISTSVNARAPHVQPALQQPVPPTASPAPSSPASPAPTPDAAAILTQANAAVTRADEVAALARQAAEQTTGTINLLQTLLTIFGTVAAVATGFLGFNSFRVQRSFSDMQKEYKDQLNQARLAYQEEQAKVRLMQQEMERKVHEVETTRQQLGELRDLVRTDFDATKQAIVLLGLGNQLFDDGKRSQAIDTYEQALRLLPQDAEINYRLGRAYSNADRHVEAIKAFEQVLNIKPNFAEANMELGLAYRRHADTLASAGERQVEYRMATRYMEQAVALKPDYEDALAALGGLARREARYPDALNYYRKAAAVEPNSSYALSNIGSLSWYLGDTAQARYYFERVIEVASVRLQAGRPGTFWDLYDRGLAHLVLGQQREARADYERALQITPELGNIRTILDNLSLLRAAAQPIDGLDTIIDLLNTRLHRG